MQMTDSYAAAVAVTIPILALAAGGEARAIRERIQKPHQEWERQYREYVQQRPLDLDGNVGGVLDHVLELPKLPRLYKVERAIALLGAFVWMAVFTLLTVVELLTLQWLADGDPAGHSGLAGLAFWSIAIGFAALIVAPMAYLALPVFLSLDLLPAGLRHNVTGQLADGRGKDIAKTLAKESGAAFNRAGEKIAKENPGKKVNFVSAREFKGRLRAELSPQPAAPTPPPPDPDPAAATAAPDAAPTAAPDA